VPVPLNKKIKERIDELKKQCIIVKETELTEWISSLVAVEKLGKLREWIDAQDLKKAIVPTVDEVLAKLTKD